ncbi:MAG: hypothetical protein BWX60_00919 [Candidatus Marinimicrobia bacterium ADurb.Bin030]|nr:MAG: hypothetical protein BWX60_00919 [Candidatus Marinimicrobia bacterium ADurb.Bin030]
MSFQVSRVQHINDDIRFFFNDEIARNDFFQRVGRQTVGAGQINNFDYIVFIVEKAVFFLNGNPRIIPDVLMLAGNGIEK